MAEERRSRRRPLLAAQGWMINGGLRQSYVRLYTKDEEFQTALFCFYESTCIGHEDEIAAAQYPARIWLLTKLQPEQNDWANAYLNRLFELAKSYGLDRLGGTKKRANPATQPSYGELLIHLWCQWTAGYRRGGSPKIDDFLMGAFESGGEPDFGEVVGGGTARLETPTGEVINIIDEDRRPVINVNISDVWDPRSETRADASKRLNAIARDEVKAELERVAQEAEAVGYIFLDTANRARDLQWLFERVRLRRSYDDMAEAVSHGLPTGVVLDASTVRKAVGKIAKLIDLDLTGLAPNRNFKHQA